MIRRRLARWRYRRRLHLVEQWELDSVATLVSYGQMADARFFMSPLPYPPEDLEARVRVRHNRLQMLLERYVRDEEASRG